MEDFAEEMRDGSEDDECREIAESMMKEIRIMKCAEVPRAGGKASLKKIARHMGLSNLRIGKG